MSGISLFKNPERGSSSDLLKASRLGIGSVIKPLLEDLYTGDDFAKAKSSLENYRYSNMFDINRALILFGIFVLVAKSADNQLKRYAKHVLNKKVKFTKPVKIDGVMSTEGNLLDAIFVGDGPAIYEIVRSVAFRHILDCFEIPQPKQNELINTMKKITPWRREKSIQAVNKMKEIAGDMTSVNYEVDYTADYEAISNKEKQENRKKIIDLARECYHLLFWDKEPDYSTKVVNDLKGSDNWEIVLGDFKDEALIYDCFEACLNNTVEKSEARKKSIQLLRLLIKEAGGKPGFIDKCLTVKDLGKKYGAAAIEEKTKKQEEIIGLVRQYYHLLFWGKGPDYSIQEANALKKAEDWEPFLKDFKNEDIIYDCVEACLRNTAEISEERKCAIRLLKLLVHEAGGSPEYVDKCLTVKSLAIEDEAPEQSSAKVDSPTPPNAGDEKATVLKWPKDESGLPKGQTKLLVPEKATPDMIEAIELFWRSVRVEGDKGTCEYVLMTDIEEHTGERAITPCFEAVGGSGSSKLQQGSFRPCILRGEKFKNEKAEDEYVKGKLKLISKAYEGIGGQADWKGWKLVAPKSFEEPGYRRKVDYCTAEKYLQKIAWPWLPHMFTKLADMHIKEIDARNKAGTVSQPTADGGNRYKLLVPKKATPEMIEAIELFWRSPKDDKGSCEYVCMKDIKVEAGEEVITPNFRVDGGKGKLAGSFYRACILRGKRFNSENEEDKYIIKKLELIAAAYEGIGDQTDWSGWKLVDPKSFVSPGTCAKNDLTAKDYLQKKSLPWLPCMFTELAKNRIAEIGAQQKAGAVPQPAADKKEEPKKADEKEEKLSFETRSRISFKSYVRREIPINAKAQLMRAEIQIIERNKMPKLGNFELGGFFFGSEEAFRSSIKKMIGTTLGLSGSDLNDSQKFNAALEQVKIKANTGHGNYDFNTFEELESILRKFTFKKCKLIMLKNNNNKSLYEKEKELVGVLYDAETNEVLLLPRSMEPRPKEYYRRANIKTFNLNDKVLVSDIVSTYEKKKFPEIYDLESLTRVSYFYESIDQYIDYSQACRGLVDDDVTKLTTEHFEKPSVTSEPEPIADQESNPHGEWETSGKSEKVKWKLFDLEGRRFEPAEIGKMFTLKCLKDFWEKLCSRSESKPNRYKAIAFRESGTNSTKDVLIVPGWVCVGGFPGVVRKWFNVKELLGALKYLKDKKSVSAQYLTELDKSKFDLTYCYGYTVDQHLESFDEDKFNGTPRELVFEKGFGCVCAITQYRLKVKKEVEKLFGNEFEQCILKRLTSEKTFIKHVDLSIKYENKAKYLTVEASSACINNLSYFIKILREIPKCINGYTVNLKELIKLNLTFDEYLSGKPESAKSLDCDGLTKAIQSGKPTFEWKHDWENLVLPDSLDKVVTVIFGNGYESHFSVDSALGYANYTYNGEDYLLMFGVPHSGYARNYPARCKDLLSCAYDKNDQSALSVPKFGYTTLSYMIKSSGNWPRFYASREEYESK